MREDKMDIGRKYAERDRATWDFATEIVNRCVNEPQTRTQLLDNPSTLAAAHWVFDHHALHQCYWNDRFCMAVMCEMSEDQQQLAAWCAVSNGLNRYWEWITHWDYDMTTVLKHLGILGPDIDVSCFISPKETGYYKLDDEIAHKISDHFQLPTLYFPKSIPSLSVEETEMRLRFNRIYPHHSVL